MLLFHSRNFITFILLIAQFYISAKSINIFKNSIMYLILINEI